MPKIYDVKKDRVCCVCGSAGDYKVIRYKFYSKERNWDGRSYLCRRCHDEIIYPISDSHKIKCAEYGRSKIRNKCKGRTCCKCGSGDTYVRPEGGYVWFVCSCDKIDCTKWLCHACYGSNYRKNDPMSTHNLIKEMRKSRIGTLGINTTSGKSIIDQAVVAEYLGAEDLNIKMNNFGYCIDIEHDKYRKIDVKGATLYYGNWYYRTNEKIDCDTYFFLGYDKNRGNIDVILIIPNDVIMHNVSVSISKSSFRTQKYDKFKVDDKDIYDNINEIYHDLMLYLKGKELFGIEDIKKWSTIRKNRHI
jgi:hypothetical protein